MSQPGLWDLAVVAGIAGASFLLGSQLARLVDRPRLDPATRRGLLEATRPLAWLLGALAALAWLGLELGPTVLLVVALLGAGALILRGPLADLASGAILRSSEPYRPGERIRCGVHEGIVLEQGRLSVLLSSDDGVLIHLPNAVVQRTPIENHSRKGRVRIALQLTLDWSVDPEPLLEILQAILDDDEGVLAEPPPGASIAGLGAHGVALELVGWVQPDASARIRGRLAGAVAAAIREHRIALAPTPPRRQAP